MTSISLSLDDAGDEYDYRLDAFRPMISPKRNGYFPSVETAEEAAKRESLSTRVQLVAQNFKTATYDIDKSIQATVPSESFRNGAVKHWEAKQSSYKNRAWTGVALTVGGMAALASSAPYIALISIVTGVYAAIHFRKAWQASNQVAEWKVDPAIALALKRTKAYEKGFSYVYNKDLKLGELSHHAVMLPQEVEYLYKRYFERTCVELSAQRCVDDQQKKNWLDQFLIDNPVSQNVLLYVFGKVPDQFSSLSRNFETVAASLRGIRGEFSRLKAQRKEETAQVIKEIKAQKAIAIAIPTTALQYKLQEARNERDRRLRAEPAFSHSQIKREYEAEKEKYYAIYAIAILPINMYFDGKVQEARDALANVLEQVSRQEANAFSPYYEYSQGLVAATAAMQRPDYVYNQPQFNSMQFLHIPALPKIEINFVYQPPAGVDNRFWQH